MTALTIANESDRALTLYTGGDQADGFELTLAPGGTATATLSSPGRYQLLCEEDAGLIAGLVVAESTYARTGEAGDDILFDDLPPGDYWVTVLAPRLPPFRELVSARPGERATVAAMLSVNLLPQVR